MWVLKFILKGEDIFFGSLAKRFNLTITGYPVSRHEKAKGLFINLVGNVTGYEKDEESIIRFLKRSKYFLKMESNGNFFNLLIKEDKKFAPFYSPSFIYLSPVKIDHSGIYTYHLGSWGKEDLSDLLKFIGKNYSYKILHFRQESIKSVSILGVQPNLTEKQRSAYELAVKKGYYEYPKRIDIKQLAKLSGISYSTFQQHLKYAEKKISEFFTGRY